MKKVLLLALVTFSLFGNAQNKKTKSNANSKNVTVVEKKKVVYQVFTRLFGNKNNTNKPWGTIEENGVGKFNDFTDKALQEIKKLGVNYIWYTGVPHHALVRDYTKYGISNDDPEVVKGRAGSPYAVKDYYNVNPDLAVDPAKRLEEFEALIARTHKNGLKVIIDIVPNHIARKYTGLSNPPGVRDFGADDDTQVEYARDNNFYYIPGQRFQVPTSDYYKPLNGEKNPMIDGTFDENPAKWTGNGSRMAKPDINDWYETVKVNHYIVMPNHIHMIITIERNGGRTQFAPTISQVIKQFKGSLTKQIGFSIWQKTFYDVIIRNDEEYKTKWNYIDENPAKWTEDTY